MKFHHLVIAAALMCAACGSKRDVGAAQAVGATATSRDGALTYLLNPDEDTLTVVQRSSKKQIARVRVGKAPEQIAVGPDDTLYIANRGSRSVSVIRPGEWKEATRISAGLEPLALAVSPDNRMLYIVNGSSLEKAESGTLMAVDLLTHQLRWELEVAGEPRAISLVDAKTARIERYRSPAPLWINLTVPAIVGAASSSTNAGMHAREGRPVARPFPALHAAAH